MDQDINLAPALERVTASVAETQRRSLDLERDLSEAQHIVAALHNQSSALEMSLVDLQRQLDATLKAKAQEDAALADIARQKEAALRDLAALRASVDGLLTERGRAAEVVSAAVNETGGKVESVRSNIESTSKAAAAMAGEVKHLRDRVAGVREAADVAERQLADVQQKSAAVNDAVALLRSDADQIASGLAEIGKSKQVADAAGEQLATIMTSLQKQRGEAEKAADSMRKVIESRRHQTEAISTQMQAMSKLISPAHSESGTVAAGNGAPASAPTPPATTQAQPATAQAKPVTAPVSPPPAAPAEVNGSVELSEPKIESGHSTFTRTSATVKLLGAEQFIAADEAARIMALLNEGEVNKVVRSLWSRAVGGATPGVYRLIIADALNESGDFKAAMTFYNQALATRHLDPFLTYLVAVSLFTAAKSDDALKLAKLLALEKNGKVLSRNIEAIYYMRSGKYDEGERRLSEAIATPGSPPSHYNETLYNMATLQQKKGDAAASAAWFEKLRAADPDYRDTQSHMATARVGAN